MIAEEEKWVFRPTMGRDDIFVDLGALLTAQLRSHESKPTNRASGAAGTGTPGDGAEIGQIVVWAKTEEDRVRQALEARKYEDAIKLADAALKQLEPNITRTELTPTVVALRTYRDQAIEAKIRNDAQAAFDALKIRLLGVLWSQEGMRLAILDGMNRALAVNDRFKDCVIINIDQDRVDFRFNFSRRRFEFPVYVEQSASRSAP